MPEKKPLVTHHAAFCGLAANRDTGRAILEFDLKDNDRIAVVLTQAELQSLYQHILSEGSAGHFAFALP
jgi:hypothetical protein